MIEIKTVSDITVLPPVPGVIDLYEYCESVEGISAAELRLCIQHVAITCHGLRGFNRATGLAIRIG
jgi:hypothetical protein